MKHREDCDQEFSTNGKMIYYLDMVFVGVLICDIFSKKSSLKERALLAILVPRKLLLCSKVSDESSLFRRLESLLVSNVDVPSESGKKVSLI